LPTYPIYCNRGGREPSNAKINALMQVLKVMGSRSFVVIFIDGDARIRQCMTLPYSWLIN
jgi:hypothetical protein